jgi:hypothetical protein
MRRSFDSWIAELEQDVIQGEYGYEPGEFAVYPAQWRPMFREGLTPQQAFQRALDAAGKARREDDAARLTNWARIQAADAALPQVKEQGHG